MSSAPPVFANSATSRRSGKASEHRAITFGGHWATHSVGRGGPDVLCTHALTEAKAVDIDRSEIHDAGSSTTRLVARVISRASSSKTRRAEVLIH